MIFSKFIHFGAIGNEESRKELAESVFERLLHGGNVHGVETHRRRASLRYNTAISEILDNNTMHQICHDNEELY
jgi:hypothetical protein